MPRKRIGPQSEVIRAIVLEDSHVVGSRTEAEVDPQPDRPPRGGVADLALEGEQSEVIRAI